MKSVAKKKLQIESADKIVTNKKRIKTLQNFRIISGIAINSSTI